MDSGGGKGSRSVSGSIKIWRIAGRTWIALCHEKITNTRKDYLHKMSHEIISENQVIVSEDLQIKNMVKNHHLAKSISDVS